MLVGVFSIWYNKSVGVSVCVFAQARCWTTAATLSLLISVDTRQRISECTAGLVSTGQVRVQ